MTICDMILASIDNSPTRGRETDGIAKARAMITYQVGDLRERMLDGGEYIAAHLCNDVGVWGGGFTRVFDPYPEVKVSYLNFISRGHTLGYVSWAAIPGAYVLVANMIAQRGVNTRGNEFTDRIDYRALAQCLDTVALVASSSGYTVIMPRIGMGLAGAQDWGRIELLIEDTVAQHSDVVLFTLEGGCNGS